jgi:hypothetical protein
MILRVETGAAKSNKKVLTESLHVPYDDQTGELA